MDVDVHKLRRAVDREHSHGKAAASHQIGVGAAQGTQKQLVAHRPVVDREELHIALGTVEGRQAGKAGNGVALPSSGKFNGIGEKVPADKLWQAFSGRSSRKIEQLTV